MSFLTPQNLQNEHGEAILDFFPELQGLIDIAPVTNIVSA
jgi:hypothetical protein